MAKKIVVKGVLEGCKETDKIVDFFDFVEKNKGARFIEKLTITDSEKNTTYSFDLIETETELILVTKIEG